MRTSLKYTTKLPSGAKATLYVPGDLDPDPDLVQLALAAFCGGFVAISKCTSPAVRRDFLIRYTASIAHSVTTAVRSVQMSNKTESSNQQKVVEDLLRNLHDPKRPS